LPSQVLDNPQPPAVLVDGADEWQVEEILDERQKKLLGRGRRKGLEYDVKWQGSAKPIWELASALEDTTALDEYLERRGRDPSSSLGFLQRRT
jgi:hypothetical protein